MAKPVTSFTFATNTNYSVGPETGNPTKVVPGDLANGFVPADGIPASWFNYVLNITGGYTTWVLAGSSDPGLDAHLVETDADGFGALAQLTLGGTAAALQALIVTQNTGAQSSAALITNTGTGVAVNGSAVGSVAAIKGTNTGTGPGVEGVGNGTNNVGVKGTGIGTASGGEFTGGLTGPGVTCTGGATGDYGALCTGTGFFPGVLGTGGSGATAGVQGTASWDGQIGVYGLAHASGTTSGGGVQGAGRGSAPGVSSTAESGYGVVAQSDTTSPVRAALRKVPQNADPTTPAMGDEMHRSDIDIPRVYTDSLWQSPWTTARGHCHGLATTRLANVVAADSGTYETLVTVNIASPYEPRFAGGSVLIFASARFGDVDANNGVTHHYEIDVQVLDVTAGAPVYEETIVTGPPSSDSACDNDAISQWTIFIPYTIPSAGAREFQLRFKPTTTLASGAVGNVASLNIIGVFG